MDPTHAIWILLVGAAMVLTEMVESIARRVCMPGIVVFLGVGVLLAYLDTVWAVLGRMGREAFALFADIGLVVLLFRVGLESNLGRLLAKLRPAALVWIGDVTLSGVLGFAAAYYAMGRGLAPALVVALALTATSIGVVAATWQSAGAWDSGTGRLMLDVAERDDISGVILMALLFAVLVAPVSGQGDLSALLASTATTVALKFVAFAVLCFAFARYAEAPLTRLAQRLEPAPQRMLTVAGLGLIIAALAGWLGFSLAIGALFAGWLFSRDPQAVKTEARFTDLYEFFAPLFFVGIGLQVDITALNGVLGTSLILLTAAILGKLLGAGLSARLITGSTGLMLIGVSMIPCAEIALVIGQQGRALGVLSDNVYAALVLVSAVTCLFAPWVLADLLQRWSPLQGRRGSPS